MAFFLPTAAAGNGLALGTFGRAGEIMGFFYPRIDFAQNVREGMPAVRLAAERVDQPFLWCFEDCWRVAQSFEPASNVLITRLSHRDHDLTVELTDVFPPGERALMRRVVMTRSPSAAPAQFMHYFRFVLGDVTFRNAVQAYTNPNVVVQHFRDVCIAVAATEPFAAQCSSVRPGEESPTKQAMRAGHLGTSPQAIGRVDFAVGFEPVKASRWEAVMVLAGGATREEAMASAIRLAGTGFGEAVRAANDRVTALLTAAGSCPASELAEAYERAVISLHDLYDEAEGTFIAAPEFDPGYELSGGYGYCWPRDAVVCALAAHRIGRTDMTRRFFDWASRTQLPNGHWYQRYWTDGSPAPSWCVLADRIQLDQTCAMVHAAGVFARELSGAGQTDAEVNLSEEGRAFVDGWRLVAERATRAVLAHLGEDHLHLPATDLWENTVGAFAYTQAGVIAALREADEVFGIDRERTGPAARSAMHRQLIERFWDPRRRRWLRRRTPEGEPDATLDSSAMGVIDPWLVLDLGHADGRRLAVETLDGISRDLRSEVKGGGAILRFEGESYMGGGPGCVNTLWLALCRLRLAASAADEAERRRQTDLAMAELRIALANTNPSGQLPELIPKIHFDYWAAPHAWASSLLIEAVLALRSLTTAEATTAFDAARTRVRRRAPSR